MTEGDDMKKLLRDTLIYCMIGSTAFGISYRYMYLVTIGEIPFIDGKLYEPKSYVMEQDTKK